MKGIGNHRYVAVVLPYDDQLKIDEAAYRRFLQYFLKQPRFLRDGGLCINPEAGESPCVAGIALHYALPGFSGLRKLALLLEGEGIRRAWYLRDRIHNDESRRKQRDRNSSGLPRIHPGNSAVGWLAY